MAVPSIDELTVKELCRWLSNNEIDEELVEQVRGMSGLFYIGRCVCLGGPYLWRARASLADIV